MRFYLLLFILFAFYFQSQAQTSPPIDTTSNSMPAPSNKGPVIYVGEMPKFRGGGEEKFQKYVTKHIIYPKDALKKRITGTVYVEYTIERGGSVSNVKIMPGKEVYPSLDNEAMRVIKNSPKWKPGKNNGVPVAVKKIARIKFSITE